MSKTIEHAKSPATIQVVEMVGVSKESWSDAARQAVKRASETYDHIDWARRPTQHRGDPRRENRGVPRQRQAGGNHRACADPRLNSDPQSNSSRPE